MPSRDDQFLAFRVALVLAQNRIDTVSDPRSRRALEELKLAVLELARAQGFDGSVTS